MSNVGHQSGVNLTFELMPNKHKATLTWDEEITDGLRNSHADEIRAVEESACAIAFLLIENFTPETVHMQARRRTHVDYYLSAKGKEGDSVYSISSKLEVSGIINGNRSKISQRLSSKEKRLILDDFPVYVIVVEHSKPLASSKYITS